MKIKWFAHAAFLLEGDGLRIITDPYMPSRMGFAPITEPADIVIRSSADDNAHCYAEMIPGQPVVVTATEIGPDGHRIGDLTIAGIPAQESLVHKETPRDNALYRFSLEGLRIAHFGDLGNRLTPEQLAALAGADVCLVPTGGPPTIELDDLCDALRLLRPRLTIPMHYQLVGSKIRMLPVTAFTQRFPADQVTWLDGSEVELTRQTLPAEPRILVLQPSTI